jgi:glycosyltransferase involved in cell wall biosynthesis
VQRRSILFLESFFGGSHRAFAEGLATHSRHEIDLRTMPDANWRWRTRASALQFAATLARERGAPDPVRHTASRPLDLSAYDLIVATDLLTLSDFRAMTSGPPVLLYVHESQMTYPLPKGTTLDAATAFVDIRNTLMADRIVFNSRFHRDRFLEVAQEVLQAAPGPGLSDLAETIAARSTVLHPGCELAALLEAERPGGGRTGHTGFRNSPAGPLIIWNHRWEYDKNPTPFFRTLERLSGEGYPFRLALLGENPQYHPREFEAARETLASHIVQYGYLGGREDYERILAAGDIVVSTSVQENFGISVVEAVAAGCIPLLPARLSYPEVIPAEYHRTCLYGANAELVSRLRAFLRDGVPVLPGLREAMRRYDWRELAPAYDRALGAAAEGP